MVESCFVIMMLCLILFGLLQVSYLIAARDVISFSAYAVARSATVGMQDEFVGRVARTTSIPVAGPSLWKYSEVGEVAGARAGQAWDAALQAKPSSQQYWMEKHWIPFYLGAVDEGELDSILNYYNWIVSDTRINSSVRHTRDSVDVYVHQYVPLTMPFAKAFYFGDMGAMVRRDGTYSVPRSSMGADLQVENHSALYLKSEASP